MMGAQRVCWSSMLPPWTWSAQLAACPSGTAHHLCHGLHLQRNRPPQPNSGDSRSAQLPCASTLAASTRRESLRGDVLSFLRRTTWMHHEISHRLAGLASTMILLMASG
ncbi:hypothetical protein V8C44DRAFT_27691 [Trichoderma aethiopicum]